MDDLLDLCADAVMRGPDDPVPQPLFEAVPAGERSMRVWPSSSTDGSTAYGVAQRFTVTDVGDFEIIVREIA